MFVSFSQEDNNSCLNGNYKFSKFEFTFSKLLRSDNVHWVTYGALKGWFLRYHLLPHLKLPSTRKIIRSSMLQMPGFYAFLNCLGVSKPGHRHAGRQVRLSVAHAANCMMCSRFLGEKYHGTRVSLGYFGSLLNNLILNCCML